MTTSTETTGNIEEEEIQEEIIEASEDTQDQEDIPEQGMKEENTGITDQDGTEMRKISIPVVKYKEFVFPVTTVTPEFQNYIGPKGEVRPLDIIKELRLSIDEMRNKFSLLSSAIALVAKTNPEVLEFLTTIGLTLSDLNNKQFFPVVEDTESEADTDMVEEVPSEQ
jgi:hypothetical protein